MNAAMLIPAILAIVGGFLIGIALRREHDGR